MFELQTNTCYTKIEWEKKLFRLTTWTVNKYTQVLV